MGHFYPRAQDHPYSGNGPELNMHETFTLLNVIFLNSLALLCTLFSNDALLFYELTCVMSIGTQRGSLNVKKIKAKAHLKYIPIWFLTPAILDWYCCTQPTHAPKYFSTTIRSEFTWRMNDTFSTEGEPCTYYCWGTRSEWIQLLSETFFHRHCSKFRVLIY